MKMVDSRINPAFRSISISFLWIYKIYLHRISFVTLVPSYFADYMVSWNVYYSSCFPVPGTLPDPKKPRSMHGTLIIKENVSSELSHSDRRVRLDGLLHLRLSCLFPNTESEVGVIGAGAEGARPQRASATLHLPRPAAGRPQWQWHTSQNLHTPEEVSYFSLITNRRILIDKCYFYFNIPEHQERPYWTSGEQRG